MNQFHARIRKKIEELRLGKQDSLCRGGVEDYAGYRETVGYLQALDHVLTLCDETDTDMAKGE